MKPAEWIIPVKDEPVNIGNEITVSCVAFITQLALFVPLRTNVFHGCSVMQHALTAIHLHVGHIAIAFLKFISSQVSRKTTTALGTRSGHLVTFLCHFLLLSKYYQGKVLLLNQ